MQTPSSYSLRVEIIVPKSANSGLPRVVERLLYSLSTLARHPSGRPALDQDTLADIRDDLVHPLSVSCLRSALEPLRGKNDNPLIERFLRPTVLATTGRLWEKR